MQIEFNGETYNLNYKLYRKIAPTTVEHFLYLADNGYYDGLCVHDYDADNLRMYTGGYTVATDETDSDGLEYKSYYDAIAAFDNYGKFPVSVWRDDNKKNPTYTLYGEFKNNNFEVKKGALKESFGSLGKNVFLAEDRTTLLSVMETLKCRPHLFQKAVQTSMGKDLRVIVVGKKVLGGMLRKSDTDFRSNIELGGVGVPYPVNEKIASLCTRVAEILQLDYCGIDILFGDNDTPLVCEVNSNAFFGGFESVTGINVARAYAEHIQREIARKKVCKK